MLNIASLNKAETCAIGLASNALHLMVIFVTQPHLHIERMALIFIFIFPQIILRFITFLVTSYLVRKFNFNDCHYDKNCVLHIMLTFAMTHIFLHEI